MNRTRPCRGCPASNSCSCTLRLSASHADPRAPPGPLFMRCQEPFAAPRAWRSIRAHARPSPLADIGLMPCGTGGRPLSAATESGVGGWSLLGTLCGRPRWHSRQPRPGSCSHTQAGAWTHKHRRRPSLKQGASMRTFRDGHGLNGSSAVWLQLPCCCCCCCCCCC